VGFALVAGCLCPGVGWGSESVQAEKILVWKGRRTLQLIRAGQVLHEYKIALGSQPMGPKNRAGDDRTPEGNYKIDGRNRHSRYHLSLHISYPNEDDLKMARRLDSRAA
jgi:murein L,D-transpeptidase YafK